MLEYPNRQEIRQRLWDQLAEARTAEQTASQQLGRLVNEGPSGLPHPDGALHVHQVGRDARLAIQDSMHALKRFTDFILHGTIPEDLLPPE